MRLSHSYGIVQIVIIWGQFPSNAQIGFFLMASRSSICSHSISGAMQTVLESGSLSQGEWKRLGTRFTCHARTYTLISVTCLSSPHLPIRLLIPRSHTPPRHGRNVYLQLMWAKALDSHLVVVDGDVVSE